MASTHQSFHTTIENVEYLQFQQGTMGSSQTQQIGGNVDFEEIQKVIDQILSYQQMFGKEFGERSEELEHALDDAAVAIKTGEPGKLEKAWNVIKSVAENAAGSFVATGMLSAMDQIPHLF